jgi:hypothetical protein
LSIKLLDKNIERGVRICSSILNRFKLSIWGNGSGLGGDAMFKKSILVIVVASSMAMMLCVARAQTTGTIWGTIADTSGAVLPNASVTITEQDTNESRSVKSDGQGRFMAPLMPIGHYSIIVDAAGFQRSERKDILLEQEVTLDIDFTLNPASATTSLTVEATPIEIQTADVALGQIVHSEQVADLPLNGRDFTALATLAPGTATTNSPSGSETAIRGNDSVSVGGALENHVDYLYDGIDNNELTAGGLGIQPSIDAIDEFNVLTSNYSAQYGTRAGPTVLITSKSGTNQFHGTLFEFLRNTVLNSANYFAPPPKPEYIQNQFGGVIGGPIKKNKLFFFFSYQGTKVVEGLPFLNQVPTQLEREGIFTESFPGAPEEPIYDPTSGSSTTRPQYTNNTVLPGEISSVAQNLLKLFPLPNVTGALANNYVDVEKETLSDNEFDFRLDYTISAKDTAFARFSRDQASSFQPSGLPGFGGADSGFSSNNTYTNNARNVALSETHVVSPTRLNQFTAGYDRVFDHIIGYGDGTNWSDYYGIPNANLGSYLSSGLMKTLFSNGFNSLGDRGYSPIQDGTNIFQYDDVFDWVIGGHSLSAGIDTRFMQLNELGDNFSMGTMTFTNLFTAGLNNGTFTPNTGNPIASFLLGLPDSGSHDYAFTGETSGRRWKVYRPFIQDNWKVTRKLVLQLGFAYNYTTPVVEALGRQSNFDFATGQLLIPGINSGASAGINAYHLGLEPRVGLSYTPFGNKTVVRAGYMILHDSGWNSGAQGLDLNPPYAGTYAFQSDDITPVTTLSGGFPVPVQPVVTNGSAANLSGNIFSMDTGFHPGMIQQFNVSAEASLPTGTLLTVGYVGMRTSHLQTAGWNLNTAPPNTGIDPANLRPYPQFVQVLGFLDRGLGRYDSLQVKAERAYQNGLYVLASYTYSKAFDNGFADNLGDLVGVPYYPLVPYPHADKGLSLTNLKNNFSGSALYKLPFGSGAKFANGSGKLEDAFVGGWQLNLISHITSGFPVGMYTGVNVSGTLLVSAGSQINNRPNQVCNPNINHKTVLEFFNTACFVDPPAGVLGNAFRTPLSEGPDFVNFDGSAFKEFSLGETRRLEFRTEIFNIANHPQFAPPASTTDSPGFGQITSTVNNPRLIQFALKLIY